LPSGKWKFEEGAGYGAMMFQIVATAREMGITVAEFQRLTQEEKAMQVVYTSLLAKMEAVNAKDREDRAKRKKK